MASIRAAGLATARVWLFDFDNTLVALEPEVDWAASRIELERYLRQAGVDDAIFTEVPKGNLPLYERLRSRLLDHPGNVAPGVFRSSRETANPAALLAGASALIEAYEIRGVSRAQPLPGAIDLLKAIRMRTASLAIVTSNSSRTVASWLTSNAVTSIVDFIVGRDTLLPLKPAPDMVLRALTLSAEAAAEALFVGDSAADAGAARTAGVAFYGIAPTAERRERLVDDGARETFATPARLAERLASITT